jgi:hypothetical protein
MSATTKHDFHPDAESLNAFAEQALAERERSDLLAHLAVCGHCRQVVALAREAADAEVVARAGTRRSPIHPDSWWKRWRLVWVPTAAVAAFAAASISVYVHQADKNVATFKVAEPTTAQNEPADENPAPQKTAAAPAPHAVAKAPVATSKSKQPGAPPNSSSQQVVVTAAAPPLLETPEQAEATNEEVVPTTGAGGSGLFHRSFAPAAAPAVSAAQPAVRAFREEQKKQDERILQKEEQQARTGENRALPPPSPETPNLAPPTAPTTDGSTPGDQNAEASSSNRPTEMSAGSLSGFGSMKSMRSAARSTASEANISLPSGLPVVSSVAIGHRILAIDKAGALFLSEDSGNTWQRELRQWTGHAIAIRIHSAPDANAVNAPTTEQTEAAPGLAEAPPPPAPPAIFEILNDQNQIWLSTDGRLWIAK